MAEQKAIHTRIDGVVQGVSFRAWTQLEAKNRGLKGWVRNEEDGAVTAVIAGESEAVDEMLKALHQGPPAAVVRSVEASSTEPPEDDGFDILR